MKAGPYQDEGVTGRPAGIMSRGIAGAVDLVTFLVGIGVLYVAMCAVLFIISPSRFHFPRPGPAVTFAVSGVLVVAYLTFSWAVSGRTIGMQVAGLRVVSRSGARVRVLPAIGRAVFTVVFPVGLLWVLVSRTNSSVQDLIFRTSVVYDWRHGLPAETAQEAMA